MLKHTALPVCFRPLPGVSDELSFYMLLTQQHTPHITESTYPFTCFTSLSPRFSGNNATKTARNQRSTQAWAGPKRSYGNQTEEITQSNNYFQVVNANSSSPTAPVRTERNLLCRCKMVTSGSEGSTSATTTTTDVSHAS